MTRISIAVAVFSLFALPAFAQGLGGPSSVQAELEPGDGLTDPQFRSNFPKDITPGWFTWKDGLSETAGVKFNLDYLALSQSSNSGIGEGNASGGIARFYGTWQATENGSVTFKLENRHAYGAVAPQFFGFDSGALSITGTAFNDIGTALTNLFWTYRSPDRNWTFQLGQIDVTDFVDAYGMISPYSAFQNLAFSTNPTISAPNPGLGMALGARLGRNLYAVGSIADANGDPTNPDAEVLSTGETFKSVEIGFFGGPERIYFDNVHLTLWQSDAASDGSREEDRGAALSAAWFIDNRWMPFLRAGVSDGTAALYNRTVSAGLGYYSRETDLAGLGLNWAEAKGFEDGQATAEAFYRLSISPGFQVTPSIQYVSDPLLNPGSDDLT